jgi:hypothetical protein
MILELESSVTYARAISEHNPDGDVIGATPTVKHEETTQISFSREGGLEMLRQSGDMKVYSYYFKSSAGSYLLAFVLRKYLLHFSLSFLVSAAPTLGYCSSWLTWIYSCLAAVVGRGCGSW